MSDMHEIEFRLLAERVKRLEQRAPSLGSEFNQLNSGPGGSVSYPVGQDIEYAQISDRDSFTDANGYTNYRYSWQEMQTRREDGSLIVKPGGRRGVKNLLELNRTPIPLLTGAQPTVVPIRQYKDVPEYWYVGLTPRLFSGVKVDRAADVDLTGGLGTYVTWDNPSNQFAVAWDTDRYYGQPPTGVLPLFSQLFVPFTGYYNLHCILTVDFRSGASPVKFTLGTGIDRITINVVDPGGAGDTGRIVTAYVTSVIGMTAGGFVALHCPTPSNAILLGRSGVAGATQFGRTMLGLTYLGENQEGH